ncbi:MAG: conjugal transfer protein TraU [Legionellales bacterium RIFCSPHIGHO2_12_FULL_42_9]|nr:MAG: conjugal transfer protein TraU [Legionellales bacterium RIFCSPHIGHO2_12_FULL_42_9]
MKNIIASLLFLITSTVFGGQCTGHFVNPITDVCWRCLFPLSIGRTGVVNSHLPDTDNAASPIGVCPMTVGSRVGLNIGYWEPMALVDVTDTPYCLVNLGGHRMPLGRPSHRGGRHVVGLAQTHAFFHVHWYKYPLITWLNLITSAGCQQGGDFDIAYLTELDPTWNDSEMSFVLNPEATLFGNPLAASACAADSLSSSLRNQPMDSLFWCAGSQGSHYPLTGHVNAPLSPVQTALLLAERMNYKLHRDPPLITDSSSKSPCRELHLPVLPKSRYRYEMVNQVADGKHCYPSGHTTLDWETNKIKPHTPDQYGFLVWRKRNCVFL